MAHISSIAALLSVKRKSNSYIYQSCSYLPIRGASHWGLT